MAGDRKVLARWREAGEWWAGAEPTEHVRWMDAKGIVREESRPLEKPDIPDPAAPAEPEDRTEDWDLRIKKRRDEKVARACGLISDPSFRFHAPSQPTAALLHGLSGYSLGRSILIAEELAAYAAYAGYTSALLADRFSLAGAREHASTAAKVGIKPLFGATVDMAEGGSLVLVAKNPAGWRSLSRLITECHLDEPRPSPLASWDRLERHAEGLLVLTGGDGGMVNLALAAGAQERARQILDRLCGLYGPASMFVQIERAWLPWEIRVNQALMDLAESMKLVPVAGGPCTHLERGAFPAQDVLVCVESLCTAEEVDGRKPVRADGQPPWRHPPRRALNAERCVKNVSELSALFRDMPALVSGTLRLAEQCEEAILPSRMELPLVCANEPEMLTAMAYEGARARQGRQTKARLRRLEHELARVIRLSFSGHFLIAAEMCQWASEQGIVFSGRGSVVDSYLAYCLGFSRIDAFEHKLHFDRFLPNDAAKRPDIDIDFEAARRNDVRQHMVERYGQEHVATVAAFGAYRSRGIIRDVGKVLGIPPETLKHLSKKLHGSITPDRLEQAIQERPELKRSGIEIEKLKWVFRMADLLMDVPTGIRSHSSGVIVSRTPIRDVVPVQLSGDEEVRIIQWDKRSSKHSFDKFDVLCLRGNDVLSGTQSRVRQLDGSFGVEDAPLDDEDTFRAMRSGQLIGIPQSASPAMRQAHVRLRTRNLTDASLVQAGIRPGVGGAVKINELIARRRGKPYSFSHPGLEEILGATYGIIVFQEQVDQLLQTFAGCTSDEAETIRESIHKKRKEQYALSIRDEITARIVARGHPPALAAEVYDLVSGFQGYGFAQGHALAFAEISIRSIWCQQNHPAEYFAALLDAQPAGYYGPATIANEARSRGVQVLLPDVNLSTDRFGVEDVKADQDPRIWVPHGGLRVALKQITGLSDGVRQAIMLHRPFRSFFDFAAKVRPPRDEMERLVLCGALDSVGQGRRRAMLWAIPRAMEHASLCRGGSGVLPLDWVEPELPDDIEEFTEAEKAVHERTLLGLDAACHLMAFERERIAAKGGITCAQASRLPAGSKRFVVGSPIRLRFPPTKSGRRVMFFDLEDETGLLNVTCFDDVYKKCGDVIICSPCITLIGESQDRDGHTAFLAHAAFPYRVTLGLKPWQGSEAIPLVKGDFLMG